MWLEGKDTENFPHSSIEYSRTFQSNMRDVEGQGEPEESRRHDLYIVSENLEGEQKEEEETTGHLNYSYTRTEAEDRSARDYTSLSRATTAIVSCTH